MPNHRVQFGLKALALIFFALSPLSAQQSDQVWHEFIRDLRSGQLTEDRLRPLYTTKPVMLQLLQTMRAKADWREWEALPEVHQQQDTLISVGNRCVCMAVL